MDPDGILFISLLLRDLAGEGRTVFVSSHLMSEMELTADHLVIVGRGRLLADVSMEQMTASASGRVDVRTPQPDDLARRLTADGAVAVRSGGDALSVTGSGATRIAELARASGVLLTQLTPVHASLEDAYLALTEHDTQYRAAASDRSDMRRTAA
jgi:ABC-2 type transport system ATP-binding protein